MGAATQPERIATLDIVRGVAVMGILAMNIVDFGMPGEAYVNPMAYGLESRADLASWAFSFIFIDGKMRGLFSFLFGASMLLVIERADAAAEADPAEIRGTLLHFRRMGWLAVIGLLHFYLIWHGDILFGYAVAGAAAWMFRRLSPRALAIAGIVFVLIQLAIFAALAVQIAAAAAPGAPPALVAEWRDVIDSLSVPAGPQLTETLDLYRGSYAGIVEHRFTVQSDEPLIGTIIFSWETIGYMLFGMAALKSGFLRGEWPVRRYVRSAATCFAIGVPLYAAAAWWLVRDGFTASGLMTFALAATVPVRPVMILGTAALIVLATRRGGWLVDRIAAAGRAAFSNYLGTSILMTSLFFGYGLGLFGRLSRIELWLVVIPMWALMLAWSKPWLERYRYGPFEWAWRSLARWKPQRMRRGAAGPALAA